MREYASLVSDPNMSGKPLHSALLRLVDKLALLQSVPFFSRFTHEQLTLLAASLQVQTFARGQIIFQQGDPGDTLFLIACGQVRVFHSSGSGRERSVGIFRAGEFFGELALLDALPRSATAEAMLPTIALTLDRSALLPALRAHPAIAEAMLAELASRLRNCSHYAEHLSHPSAHQRVGWVVLDLAQRYGVAEPLGLRIDLQLTQDDLASMLGMARETVNRALARLRDRALVLIIDGQFVVPDSAGLERVLEEG